MQLYLTANIILEIICKLLFAYTCIVCHSPWSSPRTPDWPSFCPCPWLWMYGPLLGLVLGFEGKVLVHITAFNTLVCI